MASITCGSCKHTHASVRAVKTCYDVAQSAWQIPAAPGFAVLTYPGFEVLSMDEYVAELDRQEWEQRGEIEAELRVERFFEERGYWEARADEERYALGYGI